MKSKKSVIVFSCIAGILFIFILVNFIFFRNRSNSVRPKVITPISSDSQNNKLSDNDVVSEEASITTFVPLHSTETLINTLNVDFDGDSLDDQIVAVHKADSPFIFLIVGLYNSESNSYDRFAEISTEIAKIRTFSYSAIDMTGTHKTALVYQGVKSNSDSVMKIYQYEKKGKRGELLPIGDFSSDGTIFIQQTERSEAYELSQAKGASYKVWVYSSDKTEENVDSTSGVSQIQTEYSWNEEEQKYTQSKQFRITGSRLAAKELARIQNGNVDTFAEYLNGLWYKTANAGSEPRYIYFNYATKEVIFLSDGAEGVYSWEESNLRRSGIYLTVVNSIISSMKRRFDIMLTGVNEVYVHVRDNIGMVIKETNQWDGTYKKMSFQTTFTDEKKASSDEEFLKELTSGEPWVDSEGNKISFNKNEYIYEYSDKKDVGMYISQQVGSYAIMQFRSDENSGLLNDAYSMKFETTEVPVKQTRKNAKPKTKTVVNKNIIHFTPVNLSPDTCYVTEGRIITLQRESSLDTKSKAQ